MRHSGGNINIIQETLDTILKFINTILSICMYSYGQQRQFDKYIRDGYTYLMVVTDKGLTEDVKFLLPLYKMKLGQANIDGNTALMIAADRGQN